MTSLLSPTDCYYCRSNTNIQNYMLPCGCSLYAHPDCYTDSVSKTKKYIDGYWKVRCEQCKLLLNTSDHFSIQVSIDDDDEMLPLTRRDMKREKCIICTILSFQCVFFTVMISLLVWGYVTMLNH